MKILFLADINSEHTVKWINALSLKEIEVQVYSFRSIEKDTGINKSIKVYSGGLNIIDSEINDTKFSKIRYLKSLFPIRKILKEFKPDILHAHYASSYGLIGALLNYHPFLVSVWGSDIFNFPEKSFLHKLIIKFILIKADKVFCTSKIMTMSVLKYSGKEAQVIPFGIDIHSFKSFPTDTLFPKNSFVIGTVKNLEKIYGIDTLIKCFRLLKDKYNNLDLKLLIIGDGTEKINLIEFSKSLNLNIDNDILFTGKIINSELPKYYNMMHTAVFLSRNESFGVSVLEASSCEIPVIVSNVGGLPEVVDNGSTGFIVEKENPQAASNALEKLIFNEDLRKAFGKNGRNKVKKYFNFTNNIEQMYSIYNKLNI